MKISGDKLGTAPEPSTMAPTPQSPTAVSLPPPMKQKGPSLLKPQHKTALKDFLVSIPSVPHERFPRAHVVSENLFFLNMAGQSAAPRCSPGFDRGWCHHAGNEHHFWYESFLSIIFSQFRIRLTTRQVGWWVHSPDSSAQMPQQPTRCSRTPSAPARKQDFGSVSSENIDLRLTNSRLYLVGLFFIRLSLDYVAYVSGWLGPFKASRASSNQLLPAQDRLSDMQHENICDY